MAVSIDFVTHYAQMKIDDMELDPSEQKMNHLQNLIVFENSLLDWEHEKTRELAKKAGLTLFVLGVVAEIGREAEEKKLDEPGPDHTMMLSYTSGTTGDPKGVKLTHKMVLGVPYGVNSRLILGDFPPLGYKDTYISYLPAAHSFEQAMFGLAVSKGARIGFYAGNV